ncbi:packaged DNA stabilization gp4 family protein [Paraburkholderia unamae]|uniref:Packaged DNA stabilization gp4 family protein n=1 Tax=Paraburkholderia unamae TaxID=219649 RepID=A0ACC6RWC6_9BURK
MFDLQPEEIQTGVRRLERYMMMLDGRGIRLSYNAAASASAATANDAIGIPQWAEDCIIPLFALRLAPTIGKQVHPDTRLAARRGLNALLTGTYTIPTMQMPRHMPIGSGNRRNTKNQQFFAPVDRLTTRYDDLLEPSGDPWGEVGGSSSMSSN